jgi:peptide/nickel transport system substrate-binding protein
MRSAGLYLLAVLSAGHLAAQWGGELRLCLYGEPRNFRPELVDDENSETIRYLTGGVLIRVNRLTQELQPELASSWKVEKNGRSITFQLREGVVFSDGTPFSADDVAYTMEVLMDPAVHSPTGDAFRSGAGQVRAVVEGKLRVSIVFPETVAGVARLFDQVAIMSRHSALKEGAVLGPFRVAQHKPGSFIVLARNPNYWAMDHGRRLPYLNTVRLEIQRSREIELMHFRRGEVDLISSLNPDQFEQLVGERRTDIRDAGPTLEGEILWFNMNPSAPIPSYSKAWFASRNFRRAVSHAIRREDLCRMVFHGHAQPGIGPFSAANRFWFNQKLKAHAFDPETARRFLAADGFRLEGSQLRDREGHPVEFSVVTNAGNRARERVAAMIQQDLAAIGIRLNVVSLDFASLLERIAKSSQYEACLLGDTNVDLDPNEQMNRWLSSSADHAWNPNQKTPATPWEGEIDRFMRAQASTTDVGRRKQFFDQVQELVWDQAPVLFLATKDALVGISPALRNMAPAVLTPRLLWNVERLWIDGRK